MKAASRRIQSCSLILTDYGSFVNILTGIIFF
uniref:Uncharacterized protein n=1 Tax=Anguilla anguilla TaxID=7936 RepID=A0A0E9SRF1_ANGAN